MRSPKAAPSESSLAKTHRRDGRPTRRRLYRRPHLGEPRRRRRPADWSRHCQQLRRPRRLDGDQHRPIGHQRRPRPQPRVSGHRLPTRAPQRRPAHRRRRSPPSQDRPRHRLRRCRRPHPRHLSGHRTRRHHTAAGRLHRRNAGHHRNPHTRRRRRLRSRLHH